MCDCQYLDFLGMKVVVFLLYSVEERWTAKGGLQISAKGNRTDLVLVLVFLSARPKQKDDVLQFCGYFCIFKRPLKKFQNQLN